MNLIDYPNTWDAMQIIAKAQVQIWDEHCAVLGMDPDKIVIPANLSQEILGSYGYKLLDRVEKRIRYSDWS